MMFNLLLTDCPFTEVSAFAYCFPPSHVSCRTMSTPSNPTTIRHPKLSTRRITENSLRSPKPDISDVDIYPLTASHHTSSTTNPKYTPTSKSSPIRVRTNSPTCTHHTLHNTHFSLALMQGRNGAPNLLRTRYPIPHRHLSKHLFRPSGLYRPISF